MPPNEPVDYFNKNLMIIWVTKGLAKVGISKTLIPIIQIILRITLAWKSSCKSTWELIGIFWMPLHSEHPLVFRNRYLVRSCLWISHCLENIFRQFMNIISMAFVDMQRTSLRRKNILDEFLRTKWLMDH